LDFKKCLNYAINDTSKVIDLCDETTLYFHFLVHFFVLAFRWKKPSMNIKTIPNFCNLKVCFHFDKFILNCHNCHSIFFRQGEVRHSIDHCLNWLTWTSPLATPYTHFVNRWWGMTWLIYWLVLKLFIVNLFWPLAFFQTFMVELNCIKI